MGKLVILLAFASMALLEIGSYLFPADLIMWFANTSITYLVIRGVLMSLLLLLLVTKPPRRMLLRYVIGIVAVGTLVRVVNLTMQNDIQLLDGLAFLAASIAMMIAALERRYPLLQPRGLTPYTVSRSYS